MNSVKPPSLFRPWLICIIGLLTYFGGLLSVATIANKPFFHVWIHAGVPAMDYAFADLAVVADGIEAEANGYSPYENRRSEIHQLPTYNYPRIWTSLKYLGFSSATVPIGGVILASFFWITSLAVTRPKTPIEALWVTAFLCSPMAMLAVERGNIDQAVFVLTSIAVLIPSRHIWFASAVLLVAAISKLFPLAAVASLWNRPGIKGALPLIALVSVFSIHAFFHIADLRIVSAVTPRVSILSYGAAVPLQTLSNHLQLNIPYYYCHVTGVVLISLLVTVTVWLTRRIALSVPAYPARAFLAGAGIYCGTFLIGNNFQYRAIFLLLCAPALFSIAKVKNPYPSRLAIGTLGLILLWTWWDFFSTEALLRTALLKNGLSMLLFALLFTLGWKLRPWKAQSTT